MDGEKHYYPYNGGHDTVFADFLMRVVGEPNFIFYHGYINGNVLIDEDCKLSAMESKGWGQKTNPIIIYRLPEKLPKKGMLICAIIKLYQLTKSSQCVKNNILETLLCIFTP